MKTLTISLKLFLFLTLVTGLIYPILITGIAQVVFPAKANGSLIVRDSIMIGSELIGQSFDTSIYFFSRPSAVDYNPLPSGGSNYGITNKKLKELVDKRMRQFISYNNLDSITAIPSEMLFASASGLDPHISVKAALLQMNRIVKARNFEPSQKQKLIECIRKNTESPQYHFMGCERINVLLLNIELDRLSN